MNISVKEIKKLKEQTGAGMMDCKEALTLYNGNVEEAVVFLRKQGLADIQKCGSKIISEGIIGHYIHTGSKIGAMVEVNCETGFIAHDEKFKQFADDVAMHIVAMNPQWVSRKNVPTDIVDRETEIILSSMSNKPSHVVEKIVEGKMNKFYKQICLMDQLFVKDANLTIINLLENLASKVEEKLIIKRFIRFVIGEE